MGNEKSHPVELIIEEKAIQADNFWTLHSASFGNEGSRKVTVFVGAENGNKPSALERFSKSLMLYRHPNILKYVTSLEVNGQFHLATEEVRPLSQVLSQQTPLQLCIGLYSILKAINFLHEKALSSHNNVCQAAIYVTPEGQWKLGGMEYLCRFSDVSSGFLAESRAGRYERGVAPGEETRVPQPPSAIDQYAYGVLAEEILLSRANDEVPGMMDFLDICRRQLQATECSVRPSVTYLLEHNFFNHQFVAIYSFLSELPLKTESEKQLFFRSLTNKLSEYSEEVVASQLGVLLLSRIVLLDSTAQQHLLPQILNPRSESRPDCLFSEQIFRKHIAPKLMTIFCVRDVQVRLTLLAHFKSFCLTFPLSQLQSWVLPELLVGIKDTNDSLVAATLRALADLVPVLGASTVIGGKRARHFSDGRPKAIRQSKGSGKKIGKSSKPVEINSVVAGGEEGELFLTERPSPDGGEAPSTETATEDESETWDNWDSPSNNNPVEPEIHVEENILKEPLEFDSALMPESPSNLPAIDSLDLKNLEVSPQAQPKVEEVDFFSDMEPVISKPSVLHIPPKVISENDTSAIKSKFDVTTYETDLEEGWGDELEWADVSDVSDSPNKKVEEK